MELLIMAAGMGSRFGGLKQIEPVGPAGEIIMDYSIYDAIKAGFSKVVFIIKEENYELFKKVIGDKVASKIPVSYVFQKNDNVYELTGVKVEREKPLGTAHAILCAKNEIEGNFCVINADDFYGRDAFLKIAEFLKNNQKNYALVGYEVEKTINNTGKVKRGVSVIKDNKLISLTECSIELQSGRYFATPLLGGEAFEIEKTRLVSMNMFGFTKEIFAYLEASLKTFIEENKDNLATCEFLIPEVVSNQMKLGMEVEVLRTSATWYGITYKEDKETIKSALKEMTEKGIYPEKI